ncbi:hypothetical protein [Streptomyces brasiliensis]|uniref:Uncharacterized protein n=1 Tax=Streptomyces brasiliensis TaxID=1954 RepID=A0A917UPS8_9ACTN|nr:hypothetical protein [Streptomyces brasiliensis]GGJ73435.1 hypothetical protein GCM10010121_099960 [Streptomyces brasiliensis]
MSNGTLQCARTGSPRRFPSRIEPFIAFTTDEPLRPHLLCPWSVVGLKDEKHRR